MKNTDLRDLVQTSLFAALIYLGVSVFRIPMPFTTQFVHFGNALVVIGCLLFGTKQGAIAASIGLGLFDILNNYANVAWQTILESLIVCYVIHLVYEKAMNKNDKIDITFTFIFSELIISIYLLSSLIVYFVYLAKIVN